MNPLRIQKKVSGVFLSSEFIKPTPGIPANIYTFKLPKKTFDVH